jgi:hypothetical protein
MRSTLKALPTLPLLTFAPVAWAQTYPPPFLIIQEGAPLREMNKAHPFAGAASSHPARLQNSLGEKWFMLWANRCTDRCNRSNPNNKYNLPEVQVQSHGKMRFGFSDVAHADACTEAQLLMAQGYSTAAAQRAQSAGDHPLLPGVDLKAYLDVNGGVFRNACYLQEPVLSEITGVLLDFEVDDKRDSHQTALLAGALAATAHAFGWKAWLYNNRVNAPSSIASGLNGTSAPFLASVFDRVTIVVDGTVPDSAITADLDAQRALLQAAPSRIMVQVAMGGSSCAALAITRDYIVANGLLGAEAWPNGADTTHSGGEYYAHVRKLAYGEGC